MYIYTYIYTCTSLHSESRANALGKLYGELWNVNMSAIRENFRVDLIIYEQDMHMYMHWTAM